MFIRADDPRVKWEGMISLETDSSSGSVIPWRIPYEDRELFPGPLHEAASLAAGVRLLMNTDSPVITLKGQALNEGYEVAPPGCLVDLCIDNEIIETRALAAGSISFNLPEGRKNIELCFSPAYKIRVDGVDVADDKNLFPVEDKRLKWITYGSSITHCVRASSPAMTWPAIVAREKNLNLTLLGYAGQCKLDPMMARLIRDMDADFISLKLGINVYGGDLTPRSFPAAVIGTIATIREKHLNTPLVVCSPIYSPPRENNLSVAGNTLEDMRETVKSAVESFRKRGDKNIYYVDGLNVFGEELIDYLPDELHPNAKGMEFMAENFITEVFEKLKVEL